MGPDLERLLELGGRVFGGALASIPGAQAQPIPSLELGNPEVRIVPDRERAAEVGFSAQEVGFTLNALIDGVKVSEYQYEGRAIDLVLRGQTPHADHRSQDIGNLVIATPSGRSVTVGDIGRVVLTSGPQQINRIERQRAVTIRVIPPPDLPLETAMDIVEAQILAPMWADGSLGGAFSASLSGSAGSEMPGGYCGAKGGVARAGMAPHSSPSFQYQRQRRAERTLCPESRILAVAVAAVREAGLPAWRRALP